MPKAKTRKRKTVLREQNANGARKAPATGARASTPVSRNASGSRQGLQNLLMSALVALGCWGFAITFIFMTSDPNRYLFGGMAAVLGLMWSIMFVIRLRKWQSSA